MTRKREFEHDSLEDPLSLIRYLKTVTEAFENGTLTLSGKEGELKLEPRGLIRFEVRASQRSDRSRLSLRFTWRPTEKEEDKPDRLTISAEGA